MTERRLADWKVALALFSVSLVYFVSYMHYGFAYDEGYLLDSVEKILDGQVIYRDFHHTYAPGSFYLMAGLFKAFGHNILIERLVFALLEAMKCAVAFLIVRRITRSIFAYLAPLLLALAPGPWHKVFFPAFGFLALYVVLVATARPAIWYLVAGAVIGLCALFRQDVAGFAAIAAAIAVAVEGVRLKSALRLPIKKLAYLVAGMVVVVGPVLCLFYRANALRPMIHKIAVDGMLDNMTNRIPFPGLGARAGFDAAFLKHVLPVKIFFYLPFAVYVLAAAVCLRALARRAWQVEHTLLLAVLAAAVMAFNQSMWRSDVGHLLQSMQYVFLVVPVLLASLHRLVARRARAGARVVVVAKWVLLAVAPLALFWVTMSCTGAAGDPKLAARFLAEGVSVGDSEYAGSILVRAGNSVKLDIPRAPIYVTPGEARFFSEIGRFLEANTSPGEYVLAVPQLQTLYFLFDRRNPTRYAHYRRSLAPEEERRYIEDIESHGTKYILLTEPFEGARLGQTSESFGEYAKPVRDWILANYQSVGRIGWVMILRKRP